MQTRKQKKRFPVIVRMAALMLPVVVLLLLSQTAFAQNTYMIKDGDRVVYHTSYATDPAAVLNEAGLALGADDTYTTVAGLGVSEINVRRSQTVIVDNCGQSLEVTSKGETVQELLTRLSIPTGEGTRVSAPLDAETFDGMLLSVSRSNSATETYTVNIPHEVSYCKDASLPAGTEKVLVKGQDGQMSCTANVEYVDGVETSRTVLSQTVLQQPVAEIVAVGTGGEDKAPGYTSGKLEIGDGYIITETGERLTYNNVIKVVGTAYTHTDPGCNMITATGSTVRIGTVAVDPRVIPYGTRMFIVSDDGKFVYGISTAEDCGGAIKQKRIDLYYPTTEECLIFGRRSCSVYILGDSEIIWD